MTTFKGIRGTAIQALSSDPTYPELGQIWYNSSSGTLKGYVSIGGAFASGGSLNTARSGLGSAGTQTAAISYGGSAPPYSSATETYNGTSWTNSPASMNTARIHPVPAPQGTQTSALASSGYNGSFLTSVEKYNGTSWTSVTSMPAAAYIGGGSGTQTAALVFGGTNAVPALVTTTHSYNGTNWTSAPNMNTARYRLGSNGTQTSALAYGGTTNFATGTNTNATEEYNGSAWTSKNNLNTTRSGLGGAGDSSSSAIAFGGDNPGSTITTATELWNGTSWTSNPTGLTTGRFLYGSCGTKTLALVSGGQASTGIIGSSEEWTDPSFATKTITVS